MGATETAGKGRLAELHRKFDELAASVRRAPQRRDDDEGDAPTDRHSLQARIREATRQRNEAEAKLKEALDSVRELRTAHEAELSTIREEAGKSVTVGVKRVEETYALRDLMHEPDDDGVAAARRAYEAIPEAKRPSSIVEFWKGLDEKTTPKSLRAYRKPAGDEEGGEEEVAQPAAGKAAAGGRKAAEEPAGRTAKKAPAVDHGRGKGKEKSIADMTDEEYDAHLQADQRGLLTADAGRG